MEEREELIEALLAALPFVEDAENDKGYKPDTVKKVVAKIRAALKRSGVK